MIFASVPVVSSDDPLESDSARGHYKSGISSAMRIGLGESSENRLAILFSNMTNADTDLQAILVASSHH